MNIVSLFEEIQSLPNLKLHSPAGLPTVRPEHLLPEDVRMFYERCGGFTWNLVVEGAVWDSFSVLSPLQVLPANPLIAFSELSQENDNDISWDWYSIAQTANGDYFTIGLSS